jgi:hypothetical protein
MFRHAGEFRKVYGSAQILAGEEIQAGQVEVRPESSASYLDLRGSRGRDGAASQIHGSHVVRRFVDGTIPRGSKRHCENRNNGRSYILIHPAPPSCSAHSHSYTASHRRQYIDNHWSLGREVLPCTTPIVVSNNEYSWTHTKNGVGY